MRFRKLCATEAPNHPSHLPTLRQPERFRSDPFRLFKSIALFSGATFNRQLRFSRTSESSRSRSEEKSKVRSKRRGKKGKGTFESAEMNAVEPGGGGGVDGR